MGNGDEKLAQRVYTFNFLPFTHRCMGGVYIRSYGELQGRTTCSKKILVRWVFFSREHMKRNQIVSLCYNGLENFIVLNFWFTNVYVNHVKERKLCVGFAHNMFEILFICVIVGNMSNVIYVMIYQESTIC